MLNQVILDSPPPTWEEGSESNLYALAYVDRDCRDD